MLQQPNVVLAEVNFFIEYVIVAFNRLATQQVAPRRAWASLTAHLVACVLLAATQNIAEREDCLECGEDYRTCWLRGDHMRDLETGELRWDGRDVLPPQ